MDKVLVKLSLQLISHVGGGKKNFNYPLKSRVLELQLSHLQTCFTW